MPDERLRSLGAAATILRDGIDLESLLDAICTQLENFSAVELRVSGFGQDQWPVDVDTDLLVLAEQLPDVCRKVAASQYQFEIDFYEQGIERCLSFRSEPGDFVTIGCSSSTAWKPNPSLERLGKVELREMVWRLAANFRKVAELACPTLARAESLRRYWSDVSPA